MGSDSVTREKVYSQEDALRMGSYLRMRFPSPQITIMVLFEYIHGRPVGDPPYGTVIINQDSQEVRQAIEDFWHESSSR